VAVVVRLMLACCVRNIIVWKIARRLYLVPSTEATAEVSSGRVDTAPTAARQRM
jgi:hypothetical protein